jgi:hypothetical protein
MLKEFSYPKMKLFSYQVPSSTLVEGRYIGILKN